MAGGSGVTRLLLSKDPKGKKQATQEEIGKAAVSGKSKEKMPKVATKKKK